jgi:uncharacterized protein
VSLGPPGSGTSLIATRILGAVGIDPIRQLVRKELSIDDSVPALQHGEIDAFFWSGGLPTPGVTALAELQSLRLVGVDQKAADALRRDFGPSYRVGTIPAATYPDVPEATVTLAVPNLLVTTPGIDAGQVKDVTSALYDHAAQVTRSDVPEAAQLDLRTAIFTEPIRLHEGARGYYRSIKSMI